MTIERSRTVNWWVGRMSDSEIAEYAETTTRVVRLILDTPALRDHVKNRGRGTHASRRVLPLARNAVPIVVDMNRVGLSFELASNILALDPRIGRDLNEVVDVKEIGDPPMLLQALDPEGGWLSDDEVPMRIWYRYVIHCREAHDTKLKHGVYHLLPEEFVPNTERGTMLRKLDQEARKMRRELGLREELELFKISDELHYDGEYDFLGMYDPAAKHSPIIPSVDDHLLIIDGRYIFHRHPSDRRKAMRTLPAEPKLRTVPLGLIMPDGKTVRRISPNLPQKDLEYLLARTKFYKTLLDINMTYSVRRMKRRALGLDNNGEAPLMVGAP